jgi:hypothetical protein
MKIIILAIMIVVSSAANLGCKNPSVGAGPAGDTSMSNKPWDVADPPGKTYRLDDFPHDMKPHKVGTPEGAAILVSGPALPGQGASEAKQSATHARESAGTVSLIGAQGNEPGLWCRLTLKPAGSSAKTITLRFPPDDIAGIAETLKECATTAREWAKGTPPDEKYPRRAGHDFRSRDGDTLTIRANQQKAGQKTAVVFVSTDAQAYSWVWTTDLNAVESLRQRVLGIQALSQH